MQSHPEQTVQIYRLSFFTIHVFHLVPTLFTWLQSTVVFVYEYMYISHTIITLNIGTDRLEQTV